MYACVIGFTASAGMAGPSEDAYVKSEAGQSNYDSGLGQLLNNKFLSSWVALASAIFKGMEVRAENIGDSKFRVQPFSSAKAVSIMETANEGTTIKFAAKTASLDEFFFE